MKSETLIEQDFLDTITKEEEVFNSDEKTNTISSINYEYELSLRRNSIDSEKEMKKFIKKCEAILRTSPEYSDWLEYIREVLDINYCEITNESTDEVKCEIHHHPISLYSWVEAIINRNLAQEKKFCSFDVVTELIEYHYQMKVPFCSLIKSLHEKFHNGFLEIPMDIVHGDKKFFIQELGHYIDEDSAGLILGRMKINKTNCGWKDFKWIEKA